MRRATGAVAGARARRAPAPILAAPTPIDDVARAPRSTRRDVAGRIALATADLVAVGGAMLAMVLVTGASVTRGAVVLVPLFALLAKTAGLYDRDQYVLRKTTLDEAPRLLAVAAVFALVMEGVRALSFTGRSQPLLLCAALTVALVLARAAARFVVERLAGTERVLFIGDSVTADRLERKLEGDPALNAAVVARLPPHVGLNGNAATVAAADLRALLARHRVDRVVVAPNGTGGEDVIDVIRLTKGWGVKVTVLPRLLDVVGSTVEFDEVGGQALLGVRRFGLSRSSRVLKRGLDVAAAATSLAVLAPPLLVIALAIKLTSPGPVLFVQTRIGRNGRPFRMLKFRTMTRDADERKHELRHRNQAPPLFKVADDPRATWLGRHLRRYSLDELPQLVNVLRGDMSIVGPRPLLPEEERAFSGWERRRYVVAPGITGPWQILGSSRVPVRDMLTLDYLYCANWSLWLDVRIMLRTIPYVLSHRSGEWTSAGL